MDHGKKSFKHLQNKRTMTWLTKLYEDVLWCVTCNLVKVLPDQNLHRLCVPVCGHFFAV